MSETSIDPPPESRPADQEVTQPVMPKSEDAVPPSSPPPSAPVETETQPVEPQPSTINDDAPMQDVSATAPELTSEETAVTASASGIKRQSSDDGHDNEEDRAVKRVKEDHPVCLLLQDI